MSSGISDLDNMFVYDLGSSAMTLFVIWCVCAAVLVMSEVFAFVFGLDALLSLACLLVAPMIPLISGYVMIAGIVLGCVWLLLWVTFCTMLARRLGHGFVFGLFCSILPFVGFPMMAWQLPHSRY